MLRRNKLPPPQNIWILSENTVQYSKPCILDYGHLRTVCMISFSSEDTWWPVKGNKITNKTSRLKKSPLGLLWDLSNFSKDDTILFSSPPIFFSAKSPVETRVWDTMEAGRGGVCWICMQLFAVPKATKANKICINRGWQAAPNAQESCWNQPSHSLTRVV